MSPHHTARALSIFNQIQSGLLWLVCVTLVSISSGCGNECGDALYFAEVEVCDGIDNDCDGTPDNEVDCDGDDYVVEKDCNDNEASIYPGAQETCNQVDDDCDDETDEELTILTWYQDSDDDSFGNANVSIQSCTQPDDYVENDGDCDDENRLIHPNSGEKCNGIDDNCNGEIDDGTSVQTWYQDSDDDLFGNANVSMRSCTQPSGYVADDSDCDDSNDLIHPGVSETCNGVDDDCDGRTDEGFTILTWYQDLDGDSFGNANVSIQSCDQPDDYVDNDADCNDNSAAINPTAAEECDAIDNDCDNDIDEDLATLTWHQDSDHDSFGNSEVSTVQCTQPPGYVENDDDCNDSDDTIYPGAFETCDGVDNNCDGLRDDSVDLSCELTFVGLLDLDLDGFGVPCPPSEERLCQASMEPPPLTGLTAWRGDCNDGNNTIHPGASDPSGDGIDQDCGGTFSQEPSAGLGNIDKTGHYETIQEALNAVSPSGNPTIWVGEGENHTWFVKALKFPRSNLTLKSVRLGTVLNAQATPEAPASVLLVDTNIQYVTVDGFTLAGGYSEVGGGIRMTAGSLSLVNSTVSGNTAESGGGVGLTGAAKLTVQYSTIEANSAQVKGGGLFNQGASLILSDSVVQNNEALHGGGIALAGGTLKLIDSDLTRNTAGDSSDGVVKGNGGGLFVDYGEVELSGGTIDANTAEHAGGGVFLRWLQPKDDSDPNSDGSCDCQARNDDGDQYPAEPSDFDYYGDPNRMDGVSILDNKAMVGGGLYLRMSNPSLTDMLIQGNKAEGYDEKAANTTCDPDYSIPYLGGGGIALYSAAVSLKDSIVLQNVAQYGGGLSTRYSGSQNCVPLVSIQNSVFSGNSAVLLDTAPECHPNPCGISDYGPYGGAIYLQSALSLDVQNSTFEYNFSDSQCGGVTVENSTGSSFEHVSFRNNESLGGGSNALNTSGGNHRLSHVEVIGQSFGGLGIGSDATVSVEHSVITGNTVQGIYMYKGRLKLYDSIVAYNGSFSDGQGVASANIYAVEACDGESAHVPEIEVARTDLYHPYDPESPHGVYLLCLINGTYQSGLLNVLDIGTFVTSEPHFLSYRDSKTGSTCDPAKSETCVPADLHLAIGSPLIDQGNESSVDADGSPADMGIYGGTGGDQWDRDFDGSFDYFWPGRLCEFPSGSGYVYAPDDWDQDDQNDTVQGGMVCE